MASSDSQFLRISGTIICYATAMVDGEQVLSPYGKIFKIRGKVGLPWQYIFEAILIVTPIKDRY